MEGVIKTDQSRCYDGDGKLMDCAGSGQDAETRMGIKWPMPRFEARGTVVIDRLSGLMWLRDSGFTEFPQTWREALEIVAKMNQKAAFGYRDWRLPERRELFSLVSHERINPALPFEAPFENVFAGYYWTADTCSRLEDQAWYIHLGGGRIQRGMKHGSYMVWPVRCHSNGSDSVLAGGRYVIDKRLVYDRRTGLEWASKAAQTSEPLSWTDALLLVESMNARAANGCRDWRLPNIRELESLIDVRRHTPALSGSHLFSKVPEGCWSSTTSVYEPRYAWVLYMRDGAVGVGYKRRAEFHVWTVRGGNSG
jgi:hypothetical protein